MREFDSQKPRKSGAKFRTLLAAACIVLVGGGVFAAGGGAEVVKRWFIKVRLYGPDGQVIESTLEKLDADGNVAVMDIDVGDGGQATLTIERLETGLFTGDSPDGEVDGEVSMVTVHLGASQLPFGLDADADEEGEPRELKMAITLSSDGEEGDEEVVNVQRFGRTMEAGTSIERSFTVTNEIAEPDEVFEWSDDDGRAYEIAVVRNYEDDPNGDGFAVYSKVADDAYLLVGTLPVENGDEFEVLDFDLGEDGVGVVTFLDANGAEVLLEMKTFADDLDGMEMTAVESGGVKTIQIRKTEELRE